LRLTHILFNVFNNLLDIKYIDTHLSVNALRVFGPAVRFRQSSALLAAARIIGRRLRKTETEMLDIQGRITAAPSPPLEFLRIELSPSSDGTVFVALTATVLDPDEPQLLDEEIVSDKVTTLDQLLQLLRTYVRISAQEAAASRPLN
jgi:hypothetical protein